ncbi:PREDICTED: DNA topoisomerase 2-like, partial [Brassica oleracea var. oleracea]
MANMKRSVPSMLDGLKPGQRKILHCLLKRSSNEDIKVSQVSALVLTHCDYYHSEKALNNTIIKMAQHHVGSNNLPLLQSLGQFGTRIAGGQDAADPRYLRTKLSPETRILFPKEDDKYADALTGSLNVEDRKNTEPTPYYPIVPMVLVNGCRGIAS